MERQNVYRSIFQLTIKALPVVVTHYAMRYWRHQNRRAASQK